MYQRPLTPTSLIEMDGLDCLASASSYGSCFPNDYSPDSVNTSVTTPERSPSRTNGPLLLPKVRSQDLTMEPAAEASYHHRTGSMASTGFPTDFNGSSHTFNVFHRSVSPHSIGRLASPAISTSTLSPYLTAQTLAMERSSSFEPFQQSRPSFAHGRSISSSAIPTHSRNSSTSSTVDGSVLGRYGYPTYRNVPTTLSNVTGQSNMPTAMSHLIPTMVPSGPVSSLNYNVNPRPRQTTPPVAPSSLSAELQYDLNTPISSLLEYLTATNPSPDLVKRASTPIRNRNPYFWFDIRNLRRWDDFSIPTIASMPSLLQLLQHPLPITALPTPPRQTQIPETLSALTEICTNHHMQIVNAALKIAQGAPSYLSMRALKPTPARPTPDFVSNYASNVEKILSGVLRAHVVGVVLCYESWNSGMRTEAAPQKVKYLEGLAHLHHFMREHGTRYGFIMTEIELVCVRYGGPSASKGGSDVPLFGFLELATPVQMSCHGPRDPDTGGDGDGAAGIQMTATLALFWLHMLAKEDPMPGQYGWRVDVGGPAALTRRNHRERDEWVPTPIQKEKREAKTVRGWVWPDEQLSKKERGGVRKSAARASRF